MLGVTASHVATRLLVSCVHPCGPAGVNSDEWRPFFHGFSLTRASRGDGAGRIFASSQDPGDFSLSLSTVPSRHDRLADFMGIAFTRAFGRVLAHAHPHHHRRRQGLTDTTDGGGLESYETSRAIQHLRKADQGSPEPPRRPKIKISAHAPMVLPCSGAHEICRTCVAALRKADGAIQCPKCREDATGAVNPNRGLIAALRLSRRS